jgi:hypothetical protein
MKRKALYDYIREEIINELTLAEDNTALVTTKVGGTKPIAFKNASELNPLKGDSNVTSITTTAGQKLKEMARTPNNIKLGDPAKVALIKKLYSGTWKGNMLDVVEKAGEDGISQLQLALAVGKKSQPEINPAVSEFLKVGAFALSKIVDTSAETPAAASSSEEDWVADPDVKDDWEKAEDEDSDETSKGPSASDIKAAERTAKLSGGKGYAKQLSPEDEEKYNKIKAGILAKVEKISKMPKGKQSSSDEMKVLRALIKREDIQKLFRNKGTSLNNLVSDVIGS